MNNLLGVEGSSSKRPRKPYTITKTRESWTEEEHSKFLHALQLFDRNWKKIEEFVRSKTAIQIRSHAQKYFLKVQKNGTVAHVPPPRPKRKAAHPYPQNAPKSEHLAASMLLQVSVADPSVLSSPSAYTQSDDGSRVLNKSSSAPFDTQGTGICGSSCVGSLSQTLTDCEIPVQGNRGSLLHGLPNFVEVYRFIGNIFDPASSGHLQKLMEMDPINIETALLLMRNLTVNLSSPDFEHFA